MENSYISYINSRTDLSGSDNALLKLSPNHRKRLNDVLSELKQLDLSSVVLYGSCARAEARYDSDIDIALIAADFSSDIQKEIRRIRSEYSDGNGPDVDVHCISEYNYENGDSWFVRNVRKDGIVIWKR